MTGPGDLGLLEKQHIFVVFLGKLIEFASSRGFRLTLAEGYREPKDNPRAFIRAGVLSCHGYRLAQDLNLFIDGQYVTRDCPAWRELGAFWESLHPFCRWGGNWDRDGNPVEPGEDDLNHFSITHAGVM